MSETCPDCGRPAATSWAHHRTSLQMSGHKTCAVALTNPDESQYYSANTDCLSRAVARLRAENATLKAQLSDAVNLADEMHASERRIFAQCEERVANLAAEVAALRKVVEAAKGDIQPMDTTTRSEAWTLGDGSVVVLVVGKTGGIHLSHVEVRHG